MQLNLSSERWMVLAPLFFVLFTFFIPTSPTAKSIFFVCGLVAVLMTPTYRSHIKDAFGTFWGKASTILFIYILIACLWSPAPYSQQFSVLGKYCKLIYLPLLAVGFINPKVRTMSINAYLAAMFLTCVISMLKGFNIIESSDPGKVFYNHIITGYMVALASYLAGLQAFRSKGWHKGIYLFLLLFCSYQVLFNNTGRTGYLIYILLMTLLLLQTLTLKRALIGLLVFLGTIGLVYQLSPVLQVRTFELIQDVKELRQNKKDTSLGYRLQFHDYAKQLMMKNPWFGLGTGSFKYSFSKDNPVPNWGNDLTDPHSQYWMILSEQGIIGLVLFGIFLTSLFVTAFKISENRPILLGVLVAFSIGSLSDTIMCYSTAGYLLILFSALSFGELLVSRQHNSNKQSKLSNPDFHIKSEGTAAI